MKLDSEDYQRQQREQAEKQRADQKYFHDQKQEWGRRQIREEAIRRAETGKRRKQEELNRQRELENQTGSGNKKTSLKFDWQWFWFSGFIALLVTFAFHSIPIGGKAVLAIITGVAFGYFWKYILWISTAATIFYIAFNFNS